MTTIKVVDFISSGFSSEDAIALIPAINEARDAGDEMIIDFFGVQYFTTLFFSSALTRLIGELGEGEYRRRVQVRNLSESGDETYQHALDYAVEYFKKTPEEREKEQAIISATMEDI